MRAIQSDCFETWIVISSQYTLSFVVRLALERNRSCVRRHFVLSSKIVSLFSLSFQIFTLSSLTALLLQAAVVSAASTPTLASSATAASWFTCPAPWYGGAYTTYFGLHLNPFITGGGSLFALHSDNASSTPPNWQYAHLLDLTPAMPFASKVDGLAYCNATNKLYFSVLEASNSAQLYSVILGTFPTLAITHVGGLSSAAWGAACLNDEYYFVGRNNKLSAVKFNASNGMIQTEAVIATLPVFKAKDIRIQYNLGDGDIAMDPAGRFIYIRYV